MPGPQDHEPRDQPVPPPVYAPVGMSHITYDIVDLLPSRLGADAIIEIVTSAQPNSHPHLGSVMTLMVAFAVGRHIAEHTGAQCGITFDQIESTSGERLMFNGLYYHRALTDVFHENGCPKASAYASSFRYVLEWLAKASGIPFAVRSYKEFQALPDVRRALLRILRMGDSFAEIVSPGQRRLHVRFPCPACRLVDHDAVTLGVTFSDDTSCVLTMQCPHHGQHSARLAPDGGDFVDINAALREVTKAVLSIEQFRATGRFPVMIEGSDWAGTWLARVFAEGLAKLGYPYEGVPLRLFSPTILDKTGGKLSKSVYVSGSEYADVPEAFLNFLTFQARFGDEGLSRLWTEACRWVSDPRRFFRAGYSMDYLGTLLA